MYAWLAEIDLAVQVDIDALSVIVAAFVSVVSFLIVLYSVGYMRNDRGKGRYNLLVLLFIGGMLGLVMAGNLIQFYFFWEIVGICSALLIAFYYEKPEARRGGMKAFLMTRVGDASLLVSILIIFSAVHTTEFGKVFASLSTPLSDTLAGAAVLMIIGAVGKSAQVPLHTWLPDAMEAPSPVTALIHAATMVNAGVFLLIRMYPMLSASSGILYTIAGIGLVTALVGGICAAVERDFKRIFAYSTISQLGLMFAAVGFGNPWAALYLLIGHGFFKALIFLTAGSVVEATGTRNIERMGGLASQMRYTYAAFLVSVLAMCALPPFVGFWSKSAITSSAFSLGLLEGAAVIAASVLTAVYSFRALFRVFHGQNRSGMKVAESPAIMVVPMLLLAGFSALAWIPLNYQHMIPLLQGGISWFDAALEEFLILLAGIAIAYEVFVWRSAASAALAERSGYASARSFILQGMGFDRLYGGLQRRMLRIGNASARVQTGSLALNMLLLMALFAAVLVLASLGVI